MDVEQLSQAALLMGESGRGDQAINLLTGEARIAAASGNAHDALRLVETAARIAGETAAAARLHELRGTIADDASLEEAADYYLCAAGHFHDHGLADDEARAALAAFSVRPSHSSLVREIAQRHEGRWVEAIRAQLCLFAGDLHGSVEHSNLALQLATAEGDLLCQARVLVVRGMARGQQGGVREAAADYQRAAAVCDSIGHAVSATRARANVVVTLIDELEVERAVEQSEEDLRRVLAARSPSVAQETIARETCMSAHLVAGDLLAAAHHLEQLAPAETMSAGDRVVSLLLRAMVLAELGRGEQLDEAIARASEAVDDYHIATYHDLLQLVRSQQMWARGRYDEAIDLARSIRLEEPTIRATAGRLLARGAAWTGRDVTVAVPETDGMTALGRLQRQELIAIQAARAGAGIEGLVEVRDGWSSVGCRLDAARVDVTIAVLLGADGPEGQSEAIAQLRRSVEELERCGATGDLELVARLLDGAPSETVSSIGNDGFLGELDATALAALERFGKRSQIGRDGYLMHDAVAADVALVVVVEGAVAIVNVAPNGRQLVLDVVDRGGAFGSSALAGGAIADPTVEIVAQEPSVVLVLDSGGLREAMAVAPSIGFTLARTLIEQNRRVQAVTEVVAFLPVEQRLARMLVTLAGRWGHPTLGGGVVINRSFTHEQLAGMIGTTRKTVTRLLGDLRSAGAVTMRGRRIVIEDMVQLRGDAPG